MKTLLIAIISLFTFANYSFALSDDRTLEVRNFIDSIGNKIIAISKDENLSGDKKSDKIIEIVDKSIDSQWISRFVLGVNYRKASDLQKEKFRDLYRQFMINTYGPKFKNYQGNSFNIREVINQQRFYLVKTDFITKTTDPVISIDFRVKDYNGRLVILDFIAEGISLIETQRSEFNSAISRSGMNEFLNNLEARVKKLKDSRS
ncbi:MAG: ABC transporter substrate-binding protein [Rickettsiales bacterium]|nr:ABC transporter substrate-binding protein [Rickettsiales bacterium]